MSTATAFKFHRSFPFCPAAFNSSTQAGDITSLADLMQLGWNLETFKLNISASAAVAAQVFPARPAASDSFSGSFTLSPFAEAGDVASGVDTWQSVGGMWLPTSGGSVAAASMPSIIAPNARVCATAGKFVHLQSAFDFSSARRCQVLMNIQPLVDGSDLRLAWSGSIRVVFASAGGQLYGVTFSSSSSLNALGGGSLDFSVATMTYYSQDVTYGGAITSASGSLSISDIGFFTY